jgi:hypothetical protein
MQRPSLISCRCQRTMDRSWRPCSADVACRCPTGLILRLRLLSYERTGRRLPSPLGSQTCRSRRIARPSHHVMSTPSRPWRRVSFPNSFPTSRELGWAPSPQFGEALTDLRSTPAHHFRMRPGRRRCAANIGRGALAGSDQRLLGEGADAERGSQFGPVGEGHRLGRSSWRSSTTDDRACSRRGAADGPPVEDHVVGATVRVRHRRPLRRCQRLCVRVGRPVSRNRATDPGWRNYVESR